MNGGSSTWMQGIWKELQRFDDQNITRVDRKESNHIDNFIARRFEVTRPGMCA